MNGYDWIVYDLKVYKYKQCVWCYWACDVSETVCSKCERELSSTMTFTDIEDEEDVRRLFTEQKEWVASNNPSNEEKIKALKLARDTYRIKLL